MTETEIQVKSPCKNCGDRIIGCHTTCERYKDYKKQYEIEKEKLAKYKDKHSLDAEKREIIERQICKKYRRMRKKQWKNMENLLS